MSSHFSSSHHGSNHYASSHYGILDGLKEALSGVITMIGSLTAIFIGVGAGGENNQGGTSISTDIGID